MAERQYRGDSDEDEAEAGFTVETLALLLRRLPVPSPSESPSIDRLVRFIAGALPAEESVEVQRSLTRDPSLRQRLRFIGRSLSALTQEATLPADHADTLSIGPDAAEVITAWRTLIHERLLWAVAADSIVARPTWADLSTRTMVADVWNAFRDFLREAERLARLGSATPALVRSATDSEEQGLAVIVQRVGDDLEVVATARPGTHPPLDGEQAELLIACAGTHWTLGHAVVTSGAATWRLTGFAATFPSSLSTFQARTYLPDEEGERESTNEVPGAEATVPLVVEIEGGAAIPVEAVVHFTQANDAGNGHWVLTVELRKMGGWETWKEAMLTAALVVCGDETQVLAKVPVAALQEREFLRFSIPLPSPGEGREPGTLRPNALLPYLRLRLSS